MIRLDSDGAGPRAAHHGLGPNMAMPDRRVILGIRLDRLLVPFGLGLCLVLVLVGVLAAGGGSDGRLPLILPLGLTLLTLVGLAVLRVLGWTAPLADDQAGPLLRVLDDPAALIGSAGQVLASNAHWTAHFGAGHHLPPSVSATTSLYAGLARARQGKTGKAVLRGLTGDHPAVIDLLGPGRFLIRVRPVLGAPGLAAGSDAGLSEPLITDRPLTRGLDAFAAASPFGAALLEGDDPLLAKIIEANPTLASIPGYAGVGSVFGDLIEPASRSEAEQKLSEGRHPGEAIEVRLALDPGRVAHLYLARSDRRWVAYLVDVSEQKQIELQLAQSQKMQAIGQLAGGVAHDFNNLLMAILMQLDELAQRHPVGDPSYEGLNQIRQTSTRAADLVRKLLAFSRKQTVQREILDLGELISEFEVLLRRVLQEDVTLNTEYGRNLPLVRADRGQLETAVMNLAVNARDAIRSHGGSTVTIRTARLSAMEAQALGYADARQEQALIEVSDDSAGISGEVIDKIFDPFFTTKPVGEGTGLGLATVYGIVKQSDGWIAVASKLGEGAAFRIFLPVHVPAVQAEPRLASPYQARPVRPQARDLSGAGRILFVEDEDAVRIVAAKLLRARGYDVIEAASGEEALALAKENAGTIDLMISDVVMPGMQGPDLLKAAKAYLAGASVMFISGYAEAEFSNLLEGEANITFLAKPIDIKTLAERVKLELQKAA